MGKRVGFYLTDLQIKNLKKVSKATGLTVSEIIRRAVDEHLKQYKNGKQVGKPGVSFPGKGSLAEKFARGD
ncbi:MAG: ribbon-helix-helix domain-containing protein [Thermodesulfobacteriota bacterium]|jgi:hypothetical protein